MELGQDAAARGTVPATPTLGLGGWGLNSDFRFDSPSVGWPSGAQQVVRGMREDGESEDLRSW